MNHYHEPTWIFYRPIWALGWTVTITQRRWLLTTSCEVVMYKKEIWIICLQRFLHSLALFSSPQFHPHLEPVNKVMCLNVSDSFLWLRHTLCSFLFISKLEAEVVRFAWLYKQGLKRQWLLLVSQETHLSALPSGAKCHYINRPQTAWIFVCSVMFYSSLNFWAFTPGRR